MLFLAYTGVRFGEMAALKVGRLDLPRRRAVIAESVTVVQGKGLVWSTPKTHTRREVPIPDFLAGHLASLVQGRAPQDLVFPAVRSGGPIRATHFRRGHFDAAARAIGQPGLHPHELRHTAASLAIASGADVKVVQQMLGHSSATMTLDTYGHLFENRLDEVSRALDRARQAAELPVRRRARGEEDRRPGVAQTLPNGVVHRHRGVPGQRQNRRSTCGFVQRPRQDSNLRSRLRRAVLYPLSYGGPRAARGGAARLARAERPECERPRRVAA